MTVKFCFKETRFKQGCDLQGYVLKITKETQLFIIFLNEHLLEAVNQRCSAEKVVLRIS